MSTARFEVEGVAVSPDHYIGGRRVASARTFEDRSPLDWSLKIGDFARGDALAAEAAVDAAAEAFPGWAAAGVSERAACMYRLADLIDAHAPDLARLECLDMAMLRESLELRVIPRGARNFRAYADLARGYEERTWTSNGTANAVQRMPAGPAVIITPWNAPFMLSTWKCAPALAAGNSVVLKPAEWSPLSASVLADLADEARFPPGVFNVVQGIGEEVGAALVADPRVRRISFTGSPEAAAISRRCRSWKGPRLQRAGRITRQPGLRDVSRRVRRNRSGPVAMALAVLAELPFRWLDRGVFNHENLRTPAFSPLSQG